MNSFRTIVFNADLRLIFSLFLLLLVSCTGTPTEPTLSPSLQTLQDSAVSYNHQVVRTEIQEIDDYIQRYHWPMQQTTTGLRYMIYKSGRGPAAGPGDQVSIKYKVNLLTGELLYITDTNTNYTFELGKRNVVSGLEEGVMLMNLGGRAKLVVPSHLAFGLLGDLERVPTQAVLVYDVELCAIKQSKK